MLKSFRLMVSKSEFLLVDAIQKISYGEMYGVEVQQGQERDIPMNLNENTRDLLEWMRQEEINYIDVLTIHESNPVYAEIDYKINGIRCRRKTKFPTR